MFVLESLKKTKWEVGEIQQEWDRIKEGGEKQGNWVNKRCWVWGVLDFLLGLKYMALTSI